MAEKLPDTISTFKVVGRFLRSVIDSDDVGQEPDLVPVVGAEILFTPSLNPPIFKSINEASPITFFQESIRAVTDEAGYLHAPGEPARGIYLVYGFDPDIRPSGWTWNVTITPGGNFPPINFSITGTANGVVDLSTAVPVPPNPGGDIADWERVLGLTQANLDRSLVAVTDARNYSIAAASSAVDAANTVRLAVWAKRPDMLMVGAISRNSDKAITSANVVWPDGTTGVFTALVLSTTTPGAIDSYQITYNGAVARTVTQPTVTRDANGVVTDIPAMVVTP